MARKKKVDVEEEMVATAEVEVQDVAAPVVSDPNIFSMENDSSQLNAYVREGELIFDASTGMYYKLGALERAQTLIGTISSLATSGKIVGMA